MPSDGYRSDANAVGAMITDSDLKDLGVHTRCI